MQCREQRGTDIANVVKLICARSFYEEPSWLEPWSAIKTTRHNGSPIVPGLQAGTRQSVRANLAHRAA